jgi:hypothetical protein
MSWQKKRKFHQLNQRNQYSANSTGGISFPPLQSAADV